MYISRRPWTIQEKKYLLQNYEHEKACIIAAHLGRTRRAVYRAAQRWKDERFTESTAGDTDGSRVSKTMQLPKVLPKVQRTLATRANCRPRLVQVA